MGYFPKLYSGRSPGIGGKNPWNRGDGDGGGGGVSTVYYDQVVADGAVDYWRLGDTGSTLTNAIGAIELTLRNGPTTGVTGAIAASGDPDTAVSFLATSSQDAYVATANYRSSDTQGVIELWVKTSTAAAEEMLFATSDEATSTHRLSLSHYNGDLYFVYEFVGINDTVHTTSVGMNDGAWHHIAMVSLGTSWKIYIDGSDKALTVSSGSNSGGWFQALSSQRDNITFGNLVRLSGSYGFLTGSLDEIAVYPSALSAAQILDHYNKGLGI